MKFTVILRGHNPLRFSRWQWFCHSKRKIIPTLMESKLQERNIPIYKMNEEVKLEPLPYRVDDIKLVGYKDEPIRMDMTHPLWHDKPCLVHRDCNVLVEGLNQAKVLTNTVEIKDGLPSEIETLYDKVKFSNQHEIVQSIAMASLAFDGHQETLPKRKDPTRPAWIFPRDYGIRDYRRNTLLCNRLLQLCEMAVGPEVSDHRYPFRDALFVLSLDRDEDYIQLQMRSDILLLADSPLPSIATPAVTVGSELPDLSPLKYTISLDEENIFDEETVLPIKSETKFCYPHTAIVHFNETEVKNIYETPVLENQTLGRSLMKAFAVAATNAKILYGDDVSELPEPITVQCIQTDAKYFHFSVFQLNTLEWPPSSGLRNIFWSDPITPLYDFVGYDKAKPSLIQYNPDIIKKFLAFYINGRNVQGTTQGLSI